MFQKKRILRQNRQVLIFKYLIKSKLTNTRYKFTILLILITVAHAFSQESLDSLINNVRQNNKVLQTARLKEKVTIIESKTDLNPENPEIEVGYLIGKPEEIGNRTDFSISQSFYFPSVYFKKRKYSKTVQKQAGIETEITEQELVAEAKKVWINQVFLNKKMKIIAQRLTNAELLQEQYQQKLVLGEINKLQVNKVNLHTSLLRNEYDKIELQLHKNKYAIAELCGGKTILINDTIFPRPLVIFSDSVTSAYENSVNKKFFEEQINQAKLQKSVIQAKNPPEFSIGYYSESVNNESFKGFKLGVNIPLWKNRNTAKKAKAELLFAEADLERFKSYQNSKVQQLLERKEHIRKQIEELSTSLADINDNELLTKALDAGEISLTDYYYQSDFYSESQVLLLELKKDELMIEVEIMKSIGNE